MNDEDLTFEAVEAKPNLCAMCGEAISGIEIKAFQQSFCSFECHLKYWKEEMPNLGGEFITDEDLEKISKMDEENAKIFHAQVMARLESLRDDWSVWEKIGTK